MLLGVFISFLVIFLDLMVCASCLQLISFALNFRDLGNSNISGSLGSELGELKHLQYLYCSLISLRIYTICFKFSVSAVFGH